MRNLAIIALMVLVIGLTPGLAEIYAKTEVDMVWTMKNGANELTAAAGIGLSPNLTLNMGLSAGGKMENKGQMTFAVEQLGLTYHNDELSIFGGAVPASVGQAAIHQIFLRDSGPAFLKLGYTFNREPWTYTKFFGDLSRDDEYKRVGVHYLNWQPVPYFSLGIGEAFVVSQHFKGDTFFYFVPIMPYYLSKYFPGISTSIDNAFFYGDGRLQLAPFTFYGELLVNEFPMSPMDDNPKLFAITLGLEAEELIAGWDLLAEFSHVSDQAYSNGRPQNVFTYGDLSLGHAYGDDLTAGDIQLSRHFEKLNADTKFGLYYLKLGNTDVAPWIGKEEKLVPEQIYGVKLGAARQLDQLRLGLDLEIGYVQNNGHKADESGYRTSAILTGSWLLP